VQLRVLGSTPKVDLPTHLGAAAQAQQHVLDGREGLLLAMDARGDPQGERAPPHDLAAVKAPSCESVALLLSATVTVAPLLQDSYYSRRTRRAIAKRCVPIRSLCAR
jgi:hypothetical protein